MVFGNYYLYDLPYAVQNNMRAQYPEYSTDQFQLYFNALNTAYNVPNLVIPFILGYVAVRIGTRKVITCTAIIIAIASIIIAFGSFYRSFFIMIMGRAIYGIGGEALLVSQWAFLNEYFPPEQIGFVYTVSTVLSAAGEAADIFLSPRIASWFGSTTHGVTASFLFGSLLCWLGVIVRFLLTIFEKKAQAKPLDLSTHYAQLSQRESLTKSSKLVIMFGTITMIVEYGFYYYASIFLIQKWFSDLTDDKAQILASNYISLSDMIHGFSIILLGPLSDRYNLSKHYAVLSPVLFAVSFVLATFMWPTVPFIIYGIAQVLGEVALWSCLSFSLPTKQIALATGLIYCIDDGYIAIAQYVNQFICWVTGSYDAPLFFYIGVSAIALIGVFLYLGEQRKIKKDEKVNGLALQPLLDEQPMSTE